MKRLKNLIVALSIVLSAIFFLFPLSDDPPIQFNPSSSVPAAIQSTNEDGKLLKVHYLDVGQADCILIQAPSGKNMLIDAGNNGDKDTITRYLKSQGISRLDIVVGTHPHEDHIGSLDTVINTFEIGQIVMPNKNAATQTYKDVLQAISRKGLKITAAKAGIVLDLGPEIKSTLIAPCGNEYEDINNYSAVVRMEYGTTSFLFTGDAESKSEGEILAAGYEVRSDVLKVGHHGSSSSTSQDFLKKVKPKVAVISVGKDNEYGHPHKETVVKLRNIGAEVYQTDLQGTIVVVSNGKDIQTPKM